jgi:hypothetical protein
MACGAGTVRLTRSEHRDGDEHDGDQCDTDGEEQCDDRGAADSVPIVPLPESSPVSTR